ncbi:MAG: hypothetical protein HND48_22875 [Chloroflexi bacterium]|nr:hypothetical protein [Chloroflexota bacterium]
MSARRNVSRLESWRASVPSCSSRRPPIGLFPTRPSPRLMALANAATLPLMTGAAWLLIHAATDPRLFREVLPRIVAVHLLLIEVMVEILREAESFATDDPQAAAAVLALLPDALRAIAAGLNVPPAD